MIRVAKTKALICAFVFAFAYDWFSHATTHIMFSQAGAHLLTFGISECLLTFSVVFFCWNKSCSGAMR